MLQGILGFETSVKAKSAEIAKQKQELENFSNKLKSVIGMR